MAPVLLALCAVCCARVECGRAAGSSGWSLQRQQSFSSARPVFPVRLRGGADQTGEQKGQVLFGNETEFDFTPVQAMENMIGKEVVVGMEGGREMLGVLHAADENMNVVLRRPG